MNVFNKNQSSAHESRYPAFLFSTSHRTILRPYISELQPRPEVLKKLQEELSEFAGNRVLGGQVDGTQEEVVNQEAS